MWSGIIRDWDGVRVLRIGGWVEAMGVYDDFRGERICAACHVEGNELMRSYDN